MTEYDWSPEAYERALENQNRVSNWVHDQSGRLDQYSNPFVPRATSVPPSQHLSYHSSSSRHSRNRSGSHYPGTSSTSPTKARAPRPEPLRSFTAPVDGGYYRSSHSHSPSRSHHSSPPPSYHTNPPGSSYTSHHTAIPFTSGYAYDPVSKQLSLPPLRGGQQYVIIPPKGRDVRIIVRPPSLPLSPAALT